MTLPYEISDLLSVIVLGTLTSPGTVVLSGHDRVDNWDVQQAKGATGATTKLNGAPPAEFTATFTLAGDGGDDSDDFERWEVFQRLCESTTNGVKPIALPIYHPDLARQRITKVSKASVGGMIHDGKGGSTVVVKFIEYKPAKPKPVVKAQAKPGAGDAPAKADPNAAAKAELARLVAQAKQP